MESNGGSRELKHAFRFGKYVIYSVPFNIVVAEWYVAMEGKDAGMEKLRSNASSYHKNYDLALFNLIDRCIIDGMSEASLKMLKDLPVTIQKVKDELVLDMHKLLEKEHIPNKAVQKP